MLIVKWQPTAVEDLEAIIDYIANHNTVAAYDLEDHILQSAEDLAEHTHTKGVMVEEQEQESYLSIQIIG